MELFKPSARFVDLVINHPSVRPAMAPGDRPLYSAARLQDPNLHVIAFAGGLAMYTAHGTELTGHICCIEGSRGAGALTFGRKALVWAFRDLGASKITAPVTHNLPAAKLYCRRLGLRSESVDLFQEYFSMEAQSWAAY